MEIRIWNSMKLLLIGFTGSSSLQRRMSMNDTGRVVVCVTALIFTTIAAMHFKSMGVLWWYAVPLLLWLE